MDWKEDDQIDENSECESAADSTESDCNNENHEDTEPTQNERV